LGVVYSNPDFFLLSPPSVIGAIFTSASGLKNNRNYI